MSNDKAVSDHYVHGRLLEAIAAGVTQLGRSIDNVTVEDLGPVDEFHVGGRPATENFLGKFLLTENDHVLDIGCGLGGAARFVASNYESQVTGIDLTQEYIDTGNVLSAWVGLDDKITLLQGSALELPFENESLDGAYMLHVGMNIADKSRLFGEIHRVLRPGSLFGVYDLMRQNDVDLVYPVPWAKDERTSSLATPDEYRQAMADAGFEFVSEENRRDIALEFFRQQRAKTQAAGGPPPLGLHILMQESTAGKLKNMIANITNGCIAPVEILARKA
jgi:SAM-dependent methyltransferase